jgi:septal ring factor EnvC (AmiA/AmiB activator)
MAGPTTEHLAEDTKELAAAVNGLRADFSGLKGVAEKEFADAKAFEKWVKNILIAVIVSAGGVIWGASALNSKVEHQGERLDKIEVGLDRLESKVAHQGERLDKIEVGLERLDSKVAHQGERLDKIEVKLDRLDSKVDQQTTSLNQQLGLILQRLDQVVPKKGGL